MCYQCEALDTRHIALERWDRLGSYLSCCMHAELLKLGSKYDTRPRVTSSLLASYGVLLLYYHR